MSPSRLRLVGAFAALALIAAACSSSSSTPSPTAAPTAPPTAAPTAAPSEAASPSDATLPSSLPSIGIPSSDKDLESQLPDTYEGETLQKLSFGGAEAIGQNPETADIIKAAGGSVENMSVAAAFGLNTGVSFLAVRLKGADLPTLEKLFGLLSQQSEGTVEQVSLAGRSVIKGTNDTGDNFYYYIKGDTAFGVSAPDDATAAKALAVLP